MNEVTILLVDDHPLVRDGVRCRLEAVPNFRVVAEAGNAADALALAATHNPSLMLTDIGMTGVNGVELAETCKQRFPGISVVILTMHNHPEYVGRVLRAGARGYVLKHAPADELVSAIHTVAEGGTYFSPEVAGVTGRPDAAGDLLDNLTPREYLILSGLARGLSNRQLAIELQISVRTVETHRFSLKRKLNISGQAELIRFAVQHMSDHPVH